jgi:hypothetical protein
MVPNFDQRGLLPSGIHDAQGWNEVEQRLCFTPRRGQLLAKARRFVREQLSLVGGGLDLFLGGSFLSDKASPGDIDCTIALALDDLQSRGPLLELCAQGGKKGRIYADFEVEFYPTILLPKATDFRLLYQKVGPKTAIAKGLSEDDLRGILRVIQWHIG